MKSFKKWFYAGLIAYSTLILTWMASPVYRAVMGICPMRPGAVGETSALPAFARKYGLSCMQCHVAFPTLNAYGRQFKMNGYVREKGNEEGVLKTQDAELWTEKIFPWALIARSRPFDNGKSSISNASTNYGGDGSQGFKFQPITDVDMFIVGGDASKNVSFFGEFDANATGGFSPGGGDFSIGYHPKSYLNFILGRRGFFAMDPYQTIVGNESPTVANRALDGGLTDQNGLSGNTLGELTQTAMAYGQLTREGLGSIYYAAGATSGNNDNLGKTAKNANFRLALDSNRGLMIGGFGMFGHEMPTNIPVNGGALNSPAPNPQQQVRFAKAGVDTLMELGNFVGRGAFLYAYDHVTNYNEVNDPLGIQAAGLRVMRDRAAYAELMYVFKLAGSDLPFLVPLIRENWYTTYNNKRQFNYWTFQLAHYFKANLKAFLEYSVDTKGDPQGVPPQVRVPRGNRATAQIEVGF